MTLALGPEEGEVEIRLSTLTVTSPPVVNQHSEALAGYVTPPVPQQRREMSEEMKCGRLKRPPVERLKWQWMKAMDEEKEKCSRSQRSTLNISLGNGNCLSFSLPYFGHRGALTCFYSVRKWEVRFNKVQPRNRVALKSRRGIEE